MADEIARPPPPASDSSTNTLLSVAVLVPAFNGTRTLPRTLASLARQDFPVAEWLIIDDGSVDDTTRYVSQFLIEHPGRGRLLVHPTNLGLSRTLNHGFHELQSELVLVLHQDVELVGADWIARAAQKISEDSKIAVVTGDYGIPAPDDLTFVKKAFGVLRRQFHFVAEPALENVTFTEFKSDLTRRAAVELVGGFSERFRIVGEDLGVSFLLRKLGFRLVKDSTLQSIQRFSGEAETLGGNFVKAFRFGQAMGVVLAQFGLFPTVGTRDAPYSRSRSWHRASQPVVVIIALALLIAFLLTRNPWIGISLVGWIGGRYLYYLLRVHVDMRRLSSGPFRAGVATLATGLIGLASDVTYSVGVLIGLIRSRTAKVV